MQDWAKKVQDWAKKVRDWAIKRCEIGQKRCEIGQEIFMEKGAKLGKNLPSKKVLNWTKNLPSKKGAKRGKKGAKMDNTHKNFANIFMYIEKLPKLSKHFHISRHLVILAMGS